MKLLKGVVSVLSTLSAVADLSESIGLVRREASIGCPMLSHLLFSHYSLQMQYMLASPSCSPYVPFFCLRVHTLVTIYTYQAVNGVDASYGAHVDLLESIRH